ncbi:MAG: BON domain-containing protein [Chthonomonadales bacterium]|nr:BON domain-containing protein [Chthonomonadales bacterium]
MRWKSAAILWCVAFIVALCASCGKPGNGATKVNTEVGAQMPAMSDDKILAEVKKAFSADPVLQNEKIEIAVKDGRVTLTGSVSSGEVRIKAEDTARAVPEVFGVDAEKLIAQ